MTTPTTPRPLVGRAERFAIGYVTALAVALVVAVLCGAGDPGSRAALGLSTPVAPLASSFSSVAADTPDEDSPRWDCRTMGNRVCGYGTVGGPVGRVDADGFLRVACPGGAWITDVPNAPAVVEGDWTTVMRTVACDHSAPVA